MSFIRNSAKIVQNKIDQFKNDMKNEVSMEKKILKLFKNEFEETLPDILLIKGVQFIDQVKNGVLIRFLVFFSYSSHDSHSNL